MWISDKVQGLLDVLALENRCQAARVGGLQGEVTQLKEENARLHAERAWFMHRLTQVEHERGMLMQDRLGIKISVPAFVPAMDNPSEALHQVIDLSTVGLDAADTETDADPTQNQGIDYTNLPGYKGRH